MADLEPDDCWANLEGRRQSTPEERRAGDDKAGPESAAWVGRVFLHLLIEHDIDALRAASVERTNTEM